jgi:fatty acid synthase
MLPKQTGKISNITKFDAAFFGINYKQAHIMDPQCRMLLEKTYEAIVDAGQQFYIYPSRNFEKRIAFH